MCEYIICHNIPHGFLRATVPSDHKSAFIESLVPGSTLYNHLGQGLQAAEATPNVT